MAAIPNTANYGIARGPISNITVFNNNDGSKKYMITVAARNAYANQDGTYGSQFVRMEGFVPKNAQNDGVYQYLESGDFVEINYIVLNDDYRGRDGKMVYNTVLRIQGVDILETKAAKADRKARKAAQATQSANNTAAPAPAHSGSAFMDGMSDNPVFN